MEAEYRRRKICEKDNRAEKYDLHIYTHPHKLLDDWNELKHNKSRNEDLRGLQITGNLHFQSSKFMEEIDVDRRK